MRKHSRWRRVAVSAAVLVTGVTTGAVAQGASIPSIGSPFLEKGAVTNYLQYSHGHRGAANPKLSPIVFGWVNDQGGSVPDYAPGVTADANFAVSYVNKHLDGIDGHPIKLDDCFIKNAEEEGTTCGEKFLADKQVVGVLYGAVAVGADSINSALAGKKPIIEMFNLNPPDASNKNTFLLYGSNPFAIYGFATFGAQALHAKTGTILYPQSPGNEQGAVNLKKAMEAAGIKTKLVGFDANATDLTGALTAGGAQSAGMVTLWGAAATQCINFLKDSQELGVDSHHLVVFPECVTPQVQSALGGKLPAMYMGDSQSGDAYTPSTPVAKVFIAALKAGYGSSYKKHLADPWTPTTFGLMLTLAQWMNEIGAKHVSPQTLIAKAKAFKGPLLLGPPVLHCGKYPSAPAVCADGDHFFAVKPDGTFKSVSGWVQTPVQLQKKLHARGA